MAAIPDVASFRRALAGTPMAGEAAAIYKAAMAGGVNPAFVLGLAGAESGYGAKGYAVGKNNPFGLGANKGWKFPSYAAATAKLAQTLNSTSLGYQKAYAKSGIAGVTAIYTPFGDASNNPNNHATNIQNMGARTGGDASQVFVNKRGGSTPAAGAPATAAPAQGAGVTTYAIPPDFMNKVNTYFEGARDAIRNNKGVPPDSNAAFLQVIAAMPTIQKLSSDAGIPSQSVPIGAPPTGSAGAPFNVGNLTYPLATRGKFAGGPGGGSHSFTSGPNNWQSDNAIDLSTPIGTPIYAVAGGIIGNQFGALNSRDPRMAGLRLTLNAKGNAYYYAHMSRFAPGIRPGSAVTPGQLLGYSGSANGSEHLHLGFERGNPTVLK